MVSCRYVLSSGTMSSLIASLGFISIIDILQCSFYSRSCSSFWPKLPILFQGLEAISIHWLKQQFCQLFVKGFHKDCMGVLIFRCCSSNLNVMFFKQLCHFVFKLWSIIALEYLWVLIRATVFVVASNTNATSPHFLVLKGLQTLYFDALSMLVKDILVCISFKKPMRHIKQIRLVLLIRFCHTVMRMMYFFWGLYKNLPKGLFC